MIKKTNSVMELATFTIRLSSYSFTLRVHVTNSKQNNNSFQQYLTAAMEKSQLNILLFLASTRK